MCSGLQHFDCKKLQKFNRLRKKVSIIRSGCICASHDSCLFNRNDACGMFSVDEIKGPFYNPVRRLYKTRGRNCS